MHSSIHFWHYTISGYSICILLGLLVGAVIAAVILHKKKLSVDDFIILCGYLLLGSILGSKLLYILVNARQIDWQHFFRADNLRALMSGGFVFYGGLVGLILSVALGAKIHKIALDPYLDEFVFLFPLVHAIGRIGCYCAGCCYGVPYDGPLCIVFPEGTLAPAGIPLFPVQLAESACLFLLAILLFWIRKRLNGRLTFVLYLGLYGLIRFVLEFWRGDTARGLYFGLATSQWISLLMMLFAAVVFVLHGRAKKRKKE